MMIQGNPAEFPAPGKYRITMAAIDPTQEPTEEGPRRATLKMVRLNYPLEDSDDEDEDDEDFDSDDVEAIEARLAALDSDEDDSEGEANGGPGEKTKKARAEALKKAIQAAEEEDAMDLELVNGVNGKSKGKGKVSSDEDDDEDELEEYTICTLDPERFYQQSIDITIDVREQVFFKVTGAYNVHLTGNYLAPADFEDDYEDSDEEEDGLEGLADLEGLSDEEDYSEEDELDGLEDPRVMEVDSDEEAPKLIKAKDSKKRAADDSEEDILEKVLKADEKLSKSQKKKLKNNAGKATDAPAADAAAGAKKETPVKKDKEQTNGSDKKKVQFAEKLVQDQPSTKSEPKAADAKKSEKEKKTWKVQGVTVDERKSGNGKQAKSGDKIGMRYIGKLKDGKVFDSNTKGEPFKFVLGKGNVIKGWDVGVAGMAVGGERRIIVPAKMAYGNQKLPGIPPNSELTFDLKLISIN